MAKPVDARSRGKQSLRNSRKREVGHWGVLVGVLSGASTFIYCAWWIISPPEGAALLFLIGLFSLVAFASILLAVLFWLDGRR